MIPLFLSVLTADTRLITTSTNPIVYSSAVPPELQGQVNVTLFSPDKTCLAEASGTTRADAVFYIACARTANSGTALSATTI